MFQNVDPKTLNLNPFAAIGDQWMLITAGTKERCNTMTASWGGLGVLWGAPMATAYIRPQRYTKQFVDENEYFTLSFFSEEYRPQLSLCGTKSGRDMDKVKECGFTVAEGAGGAPYFEQAELVLVCRKRMAMPMDADAMPANVKDKWYKGDYHTMYWGEIVEALQKV
ncbi:MAG: flavin reductase [Oscillospiraceae bacterium]|nr:flavin reductase [Oscillospiraceae bacterium]